MAEKISAMVVCAVVVAVVVYAVVFLIVPDTLQEEVCIQEAKRQISEPSGEVMRNILIVVGIIASACFIGCLAKKVGAIGILVGLAFCILPFFAIRATIKYPLESGWYIFTEAGREAHRAEVRRNESFSAYNKRVAKKKKENDWVGGVTLWDAISGNTTPEYDRAVASRQHATEAILRRALSYLETLSEVQWVEFDDNSVYIGFDPYPYDGESILRGAAFVGNKAIDFGCHVWAVPADQSNRTSVDRYYEAVTARYGRIR